MLANKNIKYLFCRYNDFLLSKSLPTIFSRRTILTENKVVLEELGNRDWQYLIKNLISSIKNLKRPLLNTVGKKQAKIIKVLKDNWKFIRRVYNSIYSKIAEQFKIYQDSLTENKKSEVEKDFCANGNGLLTIWENKSALQILESFSIFYCLNARLRTATGHLFVANSIKSEEIKDEKLNLKQLYAKFHGTESDGLVSAPFRCILDLFLGASDQVAKNLLTDIYKNLTMRSLSSEDKSRVLEFSALTEMCAEIKAHIANLFFENQEKSKSEKLPKKMQISEQHGFFDDETIPGRDNDLLLEGETELEDIKKDYEQPFLETATDTEEKTNKYDEDFFQTVEKINMVDFEATKDIYETIDNVENGEHLKQDNEDMFIYNDDDLFTYDEITSKDKKNFMDVIDQTNFNGDEDTAIEIVDADAEIKKENEQDDINNNEKMMRRLRRIW